MTYYDYDKSARRNPFTHISMRKTDRNLVVKESTKTLKPSTVKTRSPKKTK